MRKNEKLGTPSSDFDWVKDAFSFLKDKSMGHTN